jgi:hypothetical protein
VRLRALPAALALLAACAAPPIVAVRPNYDFSKVGRVALIDPPDAPGETGSGAVVARALEPYLLQAGYDLVERGQVDKVLAEQAFTHTDSVDPATAVKLGKLLGAEALVLGRVTGASPAQSATYLQSVSNTSYRPVYESQTVTDKQGRERTRQKIARYDVVTTNDQVPQTYTSPAYVAFTVKLVDVTTGQVLWTGSVSDEGDSLAGAAATASARLFKALKKASPVR